MITTLEIIDIIYKKVRTSDLMNPDNGGVNGELYKLVRPSGSKLEDVVINSLPVSNDNLQKATVNVNIYVQDIQSGINEIKQFLPDTKRLEQLTKLALSALEDVNRTNYFFDITSQTILNEEAINQHFTNIRIEFRNINL